MDTILRNKGFWMYAQCGCGGTLTHKYKSKTIDYEVWAKPNKQIFELKLYGRKVKAGRAIELEQTLNEILNSVN